MPLAINSNYWWKLNVVKPREYVSYHKGGSMPRRVSTTCAKCTLIKRVLEFVWLTLWLHGTQKSKERYLGQVEIKGRPSKQQFTWHVQTALLLPGHAMRIIRGANVPGGSFAHTTDYKLANPYVFIWLEGAPPTRSIRYPAMVGNWVALLPATFAGASLPLLSEMPLISCSLLKKSSNTSL